MFQLSLKILIFNITSLVLFLFFVGCAKQTGSIYKPSEVGQVMKSQDGIVLNSRKVLISGLSDEETNWGSIIGAVVAGSAVYGVTEGDTALSQAGIIIATIGGAMAGKFVEEKINTTKGHEYTIEIEDEKKVTIVQAVSKDDDLISPGSYVRIIYSSSGLVRVIP